jgi:hypothetical protein
LDLSADEAEAVGRMRAAGGFTSDMNLLRSALCSLGLEMQIELPNGCFDLREKTFSDSARAKRHRRDRAQAKMSLPKQPRIYAKPKRPAGNHPWRGPDGLMS